MILEPLFIWKYVEKVLTITFIATQLQDKCAKQVRVNVAPDNV